MKMNKKLHIGVIGVGHLGNFHLKQLLKIKNIILTGFYDTNLKRALEIEKKYNINNFLNIRELLQISEAVTIVTPTSTHYKIAELALEYNCHIFIEKPITNNLKEAQTLIAIAKQKQRIIQVGHIERFNPAFMALKKLNIKPRFIEVHRLAPFNTRGNDVPVILDLMIHDLDIISSLIPSKIINIKANGVKLISENIDIANTRIEYENKCVVNLTASRISHKEMRKLRLFQKNSYITLDFKKNKLEEYTIKNKPKNLKENNLISCKKYNVVVHDALKKELEHFIYSINNSLQPITDGNSASFALELALKIKKIIEKK